MLLSISHKHSLHTFRGEFVFSIEISLLFCEFPFLIMRFITVTKHSLHSVPYYIRLVRNKDLSDSQFNNKFSLWFTSTQKAIC